jgi:ribosomal protein S18 acetylase RimI-like enzyme
MALDAICQTALEALQAKASAYQVGYRPFVEIPPASNDTTTAAANTLYGETLLLPMTAKVATLSLLSRQQQQQQNETTYVPTHFTSNDIQDASSGNEISSPSCRRRSRQQSPLVNAGYAIRVAQVLCQVQHFVQYHHQQQQLSNNPPQQQREQECTFQPDSCPDDRSHAPTTSSSMPIESNPCNDCIQIIVLGAGLDVVGLWALLHHSQCLSPGAVSLRVLELDVPAIMDLKRQALRDWTCWRETTNGTNDSAETTNRPLHTTFQYVSGNNDANVTAPSLTLELMSVDLQDVSMVQQALATSTLHSHHPTLILSEVVLAYLEPASTDAIVYWFATHWVSHHPTSCLVVWEPWGSSSEQDEACPLSVTTGYQRSYFSLFARTLHKASSATTNGPPYPLGSSLLNIQQRLSRLGYQAVITTAAAAAAATHYTVTRVQEPWDEGAALQLHLHSYALVCAFATNNTTTTTTTVQQRLFRMGQCPWWTGIRPQQVMSRLRPTVEHVLHPESLESCPVAAVWLRSPLMEDEQAIRDLYQTTYQYLFVDYPAVRKVVHTAHITDFASHSSTTTNDRDVSAIAQRFRKDGGMFVVLAVHDHGLTLAGTIVGFVGARSLPGRSRTLELQRLIVHASYRQQGLATHLLQAVEAFGRTKYSTAFAVEAITPAKLQGSNRFYQSQGFTVQEELYHGTMLMKIYSKQYHLQT